MAPLIALIITTLACRISGMAGVAVFNTWEAATRAGLTALFLLTASAHFNSMKNELVAMVPPWVPKPQLVVSLTGICEIAGAIGLWIPPLQRITGIALILFLLAILPANIHAAQTGATLQGKPVPALWLRIPIQALFIGLTWWSTQSAA